MHELASGSCFIAKWVNFILLYIIIFTSWKKAKVHVVTLIFSPACCFWSTLDQHWTLELSQFWSNCEAMMELFTSTDKKQEVLRDVRVLEGQEAGCYLDHHS